MPAKGTKKGDEFQIKYNATMDKIKAVDAILRSLKAGNIVEIDKQIKRNRRGVYKEYVPITLTGIVVTVTPNFVRYINNGIPYTVSRNELIASDGGYSLKIVG